MGRDSKIDVARENPDIECVGSFNVPQNGDGKLGNSSGQRVKLQTSWLYITCPGLDYDQW